MRTRRFFAVIWRINAVLLLLLGLGGVFMIGTMIAATTGTLRPDRSDDPVADAVLPANQELAARLGAFVPLRGSKMLRAQLEVGGQSYSKFAFSEREDAIVRNILLLDPATSRARWLMPTMTGALLSGIVIWEDGSDSSTASYLRADSDNTAMARVLVYTVAREDTNRDGTVDKNDITNLALSDPDGERFQIVLKNITRINSTALLPDGKLAILYTTASELRRAVVDPVTFEVGEDVEIVVESR